MRKIKTWVANYWYHYKWHTLIALFFIIVFTIMIVQSTTRKDSDIYIIYAGPKILSESEVTAIKDSFEQIMDTDYNGDGTNNVQILDLILMNQTQLYEAYESGYNDYFLSQKTINNNRETLTAQGLAGDYIILLIDPEWYEPIHESEMVVTLSQIDVAQGIAYNDDAIFLKSLDIAKFYTAFDVLPNNTLICIRRKSTTSLTPGSKKRFESHYEAHLDFFKKIVSFELPE